MTFVTKPLISATKMKRGVTTYSRMFSISDVEIVSPIIRQFSSRWCFYFSLKCLYESNNDDIMKHFSCVKYDSQFICFRYVCNTEFAISRYPWHASLVTHPINYESTQQITTKRIQSIFTHPRTHNANFARWSRRTSLTL